MTIKKTKTKDAENRRWGPLGEEEGVQQESEGMEITKDIMYVCC